MTERYLNVIEDQTYNLTMGDAGFLFHFYAFRGLMYFDVKQDDEYLLAGKRVMANRWLLPTYMTGDNGNLRFETYKSDGEDYVWWEGFNEKFRLVSYTEEEIAEMDAEATGGGE